MWNDTLFQIFCWATAQPQIFLLGSLPSTSLVHQPLQGIYKAVRAALPSARRWHPALHLLPSWPRHGCCQPQTMSGRNWFLEDGQLATAQPGQGRNDANQQGEMLWGPGEICNCSISWGHLSGQNPKRCAMQAPGQDSTSSQTWSSQTQRKLSHFLLDACFILKDIITFPLSLTVKTAPGA